jgi:hypothetical protein
VFVVASISPLLQAKQASAQSLADKETARALMDDGDAKRDQKDYKAALAAYEKADALMHVPTTGVEVARMQAQLGMLLEARETLTRVIRIPAKDREPTAFIHARKAADQLNDELAKRIPAVLIIVSGLEPGQTPEVMIDSDRVPAAVLNVPRKVNPGPHAILVRAGTAEKRTEVAVAERETRTVTVDISKVGYIDPPKPDVANSDTSEESATPKILTYAGFGLAIVGIGVGAVTGIMSMSKVSDIKPDCPDNKCPQSRAADIDNARKLGNISTVGFVAGGVGLVAGIIGLVMSGGNKESSSPGTSALVKTKPLVGAGFIGLDGTF